MSSNTFEVTRAPGRIESVTFAKSKPKSDTDNGAGVKKLKLWIDVSSTPLWRATVPLFHGAVDEHTLQRVAKEQGSPGFETRSKKKLGVSNVKVMDPQGKILFESPTARIERPRLIIGKEGKTAWLVIGTEIAIPKRVLADLDDYFKADVQVSVANAQMDVEDEVAAKEKAAKAKEKLAKAPRPKKKRR